MTHTPTRHIQRKRHMDIHTPTRHIQGKRHINTRTSKVSKGAKIINRYNQVPHLTQDINGKVTNSQLDTTNESQDTKRGKDIRTPTNKTHTKE